MEIFKNPNFEFINYRKRAIMFSAILIGIGILSLIFHGGPRYSIDFTGGASINFKFSQEMPIDEIRQAVGNTGYSSFEVTHFGDRNHVLVRLQVTENDTDYLARLQNQFNKDFPNISYVVEQNDLVGPKVGTELREKALLALLFSMIGIIIYISIRFEADSFLGVTTIIVFGLIVLMISSSKIILSSDLWTILLILVSLGVVGLICLKFDFKYAVGAIVALIHDVVVTVGVFSLLNEEMSLTIVAALLTIVGYSLNDTIVIFDRIREDYPKERKRLPLDRIINKSINNTLSRTIITSLTTLLVVLILLFFGGEVIRPFALALSIGIVTGTYSTIFIASPVLIYWHNKFGEADKNVARRIVANN